MNPRLQTFLLKAAGGLLLAWMLGLWLLSHGDKATGSLFFGTLQIQGAGSSLWSVLMPRAWRTLALVLGALMVAVPLGWLGAQAAYRIGFGLPRLALLLGRVLVAFPVVGLALLTMSRLVNETSLPIESLLPYTPPMERDAEALRLGRELWAWLVPLWVLAVPLTGRVLSEAATLLSNLSPLAPELSLGLRARGLAPRHIRHHHLWAAGGVKLLRRLPSIALLALMLVPGVEHTLGVPGWGEYLAHAVRDAALPALAGCVWAGAWMALVLQAAMRGLAWLRLGDEVLVRTTVLPRSVRFWSWTDWLWLFVVITLSWVLALCLQPSPPLWLRDQLLPGLLSWLPLHMREPLLAMVPGWLADLHGAGVITAWAIVGQLVLILPLVLTVQGRACLGVQLDWPVLAWGLALLSPQLAGGDYSRCGLLLGLVSAPLWAQVVRRSLDSAPVQAALVLGVPHWQAWVRHESLRTAAWLAGWCLETAGWALLLVVTARSFDTASVAQPSLGSLLGEAHGTVLQEPSTAFWPALAVTLGVLALWSTGRWLMRLPGPAVAREHTG